MNTTTSPADTCPPWCTEQHEGPAIGWIHRTDRAEMVLNIYRGHIGTRAGLFGLDAPEVAIHASYGAPEAKCDLYLQLADAGELAALIEIMAHATPDEHRTLARLIRERAALVVDPGTERAPVV